MLIFTKIVTPLYFSFIFFLLSEIVDLFQQFFMIVSLEINVWNSLRCFFPLISLVNVVTFSGGMLTDVVFRLEEC